MSKLWQESRATSAAVDAVRRERVGKARAELRAMLERELAGRGVSPSPLWIDRTLDHLHDSPAEKRELLIKGRVYHAIQRLIGSTASLEAWLDWDTDEEGYLAVHIGERRVGTLDEAATIAYRAVMKAAGERDESPYTQARLAPRPRPGRYLVELRLPGDGR